MTKKNDAIQQIIDAINNDNQLCFHLEIKQDENGEWRWYYGSTINSLWSTGELYDSKEELIIGLIKWLAVNLIQHDDLIYNVIKRVESREAKTSEQTE